MRSSLVAAVLTLGAPLVAAAEPLLGPAVGNADLLAAEGTRLYNEKAFDQARDRFLKATRVTPATLPTYLLLARAYFALRDLERACHVYRVYVKTAPDSPDRAKAQDELDLCERQLTASGVTPQLSQSYVALKAAFFEALDKGNFEGPASALEVLRALVAAGYAAPDLGDLAAKLARATEEAAEATHRAVLERRTKVAPSELHRAKTLYEVALDCGAPRSKQAAHAAFVEGLALLLEAKPSDAEAQFQQAAELDPTDAEARFCRALATFTAGDKAGALRLLEAQLPTDPRTSILRVAVAMDGASEGAAVELEKLLFARRYKSTP